MTAPAHTRPPVLPLVLVVDDDTSVGGTFERILAGAGYCVQSANSFEDASELLMQTAFDAAVVDICLGKKDGLDLLAPVSGDQSGSTRHHGHRIPHDRDRHFRRQT